MVRSGLRESGRRKERAMAWVEQHGGGFRVRARAAGRVYTDSVHAARTGAAARAEELTGQERTRRDGIAEQVRQARAASARSRLGPDPTLGAWAAHWSTTLAVTEVTRANYECYLRVHILPRFGHTPLSLIGRSDVKAWAVGLRARYMPSTVTSITAVLSALLADAARERLIPVNPCHYLRLGPRRTRPQPIATPAQIHAIAARMPRTEALLVITAAYTGMRWGELAGLHRDNVVLDPPGSRVVPHLRVDPDLGALHEVAGRLWLGPPKTESSERIVVLPRFLTQLLAAHLAEHPHRFVFTGRDGGHLRRGAFRARFWLPALAGDPEHPDPDRRGPVCAGMTFHRLRHAHKTWMIEDGIPEIAQYARLGHRTPGVAARYAHPTYVMWHRLLQALQTRWQHAASTDDTQGQVQAAELMGDTQLAAA